MQKMDFPKKDNTHIYSILQKTRIYKIIIFQEVTRSCGSL